MKKPTVYMTQVPHRRDPETRAFVPAFNTTTANEHGEVVVLMPPQASFYATCDLVKQMREKLKGYSYEAGDSLVAMGDPCITAVACAILGSFGGKFSILKWDKNIGRYIKSNIRI